MKNDPAQNSQTAHRFLLMVYLAALAVGFTVARPQPAYADDEIVPPDVPDILKVPRGHKVFLAGHAIGTQGYFCVPSDADESLVWTFFGPQATLFNDYERQIITHFLSPNPDKGNLPSPTWQDSRDTSTIWAMMVQGASFSDPPLVEPGAIPWLLLQVVGAEPGPTGGQRLTRTKYIQRLNTSGGIAPLSKECTEVGKKALVPYTADYFFYKSTKHE
jgi:hypothetical protein